ncbi:hypothetical protein [Anabaena sp. UHCC 0204]|uniref:hypothetical protein n=1 Tax=Anabaena sp. UHCC 0204 TaxID=2590009 RepID=UPI0014457C29|nr:hypothetical protein [Anabaena sp. UHCC 0204]MTJ10120.1 hypothetical protein [Anabaena sp. UHCC 0204]
MADELLKCIKCNGFVSSRLTRCPHCKTEDYKVLYNNCLICRQNFPVTKHEISTKKFHDECRAKVDSEWKNSDIYTNIQCPLCKTNHYIIKSTTSWHCNKCGHPITEGINAYIFKSCSICDLPLYQDSSIRHRINGQVHYFHHICLQSPENRNLVQDLLYKEQKRVKKQKTDNLKKKILWSVVVLVGISLIQTKILIVGIIMILLGIFGIHQTIRNVNIVN